MLPSIKIPVIPHRIAAKQWKINLSLINLVCSMNLIASPRKMYRKIANFGEKTVSQLAEAPPSARPPHGIVRFFSYKSCDLKFHAKKTKFSTERIFLHYAFQKNLIAFISFLFFFQHAFTPMKMSLYSYSTSLFFTISPIISSYNSIFPLSSLSDSFPIAFFSCWVPLVLLLYLIRKLCT